jgi:imidazolonepropionase-like amidohydrolase
MAIVLICGNVFDGASDTLLARTEMLITGNVIAEMAMSVTRSSSAEVVDLTQHTVMPQLIVPGLVPHRVDWRELHLLVQSGVPAARVLQAATSAAAALMGRTDLGLLAPGKTASMIAVRGDPFEDITIVGQPDFIIADGRILRRSARRFVPWTVHPYQRRSLNVLSYARGTPRR